MRIENPVAKNNRRFTGRQDARNAGKVIEIAREKASGNNRAQNRRNRRKYRRADRRLVISTRKSKSPATERRRAHTSETRISAIAHSAAERTRKKKGSRYSRRAAVAARRVI